MGLEMRIPRTVVSLATQNDGLPQLVWGSLSTEGRKDSFLQSRGRKRTPLLSPPAPAESQALLSECAFKTPDTHPKYQSNQADEHRKQGMLHMKNSPKGVGL